MSPQNRKKIENYLQSDRKWDTGVQLYDTMPGRNLAYARILNHQRGTQKDLDALHYELARLAGIKQGKLRSLLRGEDTQLEVVETEKAEGSAKTTADQNELPVDYSKMEYPELVALVKDRDLKTKDRKGDTLAEALKADDERIEKEAAWWAKGEKYQQFSEEDLKALVTGRGLSLAENEDKKSLIGQLIASDESAALVKEAEEAEKAAAEEAEKKSGKQKQEESETSETSSPS